MRPRSLWASLLLCLPLVLPICAAPRAAGQPDPPIGPIENLRARLAALERLIGPVRSLEGELRDGSLVAVVRKTRVDYVERAALRESLRFEVVRTALTESVSKADPDSIGTLGDEAFVSSAASALEREIVAESNAHRETISRDRARIEERIRQLREELARLEGGARPQAPPVPEDLTARKRAMGEELNRVRTEGRWSPDHHYQVGVFLGNARTSAGLDAIEVLIRGYAACYATKNADNDRVQQATKAGRYPTPGDRIGALGEVGRAFNHCIDAAFARWKGGPR